MTAQLNHIAQIWWMWMFSMFWQVSLLIILVTLLDMAIRRWAWPQVRYALWGLIFIKLIISPAWQMPTSVVSWIQPKVEKRISIQVEPGNLITATSQQTSVATTLQQEKVTPQPVTPKLNWKGFAFLFWLAGVIALSLMLFLKMLRLPKRHKAQTQGIVPEWFDDIFAKTSQRLKLRKIPIVVFSRDAKTPAVYGLLRPVLLLPVRGLDQFSKEQAEHLVMHELCHLKRGDLIVHWFCIILQIFYWFNPLLIWTRRQMRHVCEICCDLSVANILREKTPDYRNTLLESTYKLLTETIEPGLGLLGLFEESFRIASRLEWLEKKTWKNHKRKIIAAVVTSLVMVICVMPMAGRSQPTELKYSKMELAINAKEALSDKDAKLIKAAEKGDLKAIRTALTNGAQVNTKDTNGQTALIVASQLGHADAVKFLLDKGADVNAKTNIGLTALFIASERGHTDVVKILLDKGADVNTKTDTTGPTALIWASMYGRADVVKILLDKGADVNVKATINNDQYTALNMAKKYRLTDIVQMLEKAGAKEDMTRDNDAKLIEAAEKGDLEAVRAALTNGADVNAKGIGRITDMGKTWNANDVTALIMASQNGHTAVVKILLEKGADVNLKKLDTGSTALMMASSNGHTKIIRLLLDKGADVNAKIDENGTTSLFMASLQGHTDIVKLLIENGADVNAVTTDGNTALNIAKENKHKDIIKLLEKAGASGIIASNNLAQNILRSAALAQEAYWVDNETYTDSIKKLEDNYGLFIDEGLTLQIFYADKDHYQMIAFHEQGNKKYKLNGPGGRIEEYTK